MMILPTYSEITRTPLAELDLARIQKDYTTSSNLQSKFNYAYALLRTSSFPNYRENLTTAQKLFEELYIEHESTRDQTVYYLAVCLSLQGKYRDSKRYIEMFVRLHPQNVPGNEMRQIVEDGIKREAIVGAGIVGVGVAVVGLLASVLFKRN